MLGCWTCVYGRMCYFSWFCCCVVDVIDARFVAVISEILDRYHVLEGHRLTVAPYYECLGPVRPGMGSEPCWTPPAITVNFDPCIVQFVMQTDAVRSHIESSLNDVCPRCTVTWPDSATRDNGSVEISFGGAYHDVSSGTISKACRDRLTELVGMMEAGSVDVLQDVWSRFVEQWKQHFADVDETVRVQLDEQLFRACVIGERDKCTELIAKLGRLQSELINELQRASETMTVISPLQLALLQTCGFLQTESTDQLTATVVDNVITLEGQPDKVVDRKMKMLETLAVACSDKVHVDEYVLHVLKTEPFRRHVDQLLKHVTGVVWCIAEKEIEVYGKDKDKVSHTVVM